MLSVKTIDIFASRHKVRSELYFVVNIANIGCENYYKKTSPRVQMYHSGWNVNLDLYILFQIFFLNFQNETAYNMRMLRIPSVSTAKIFNSVKTSCRLHKDHNGPMPKRTSKLRS